MKIAFFSQPGFPIWKPHFFILVLMDGVSVAETETMDMRKTQN